MVEEVELLLPAQMAFPELPIQVAVVVEPGQQDRRVLQVIIQVPVVTGGYQQ